MNVIIMAGGRGTRISAVANDIPKPMISIGGKPVLEYQINCLKAQGLTQITLVIGYLGDVIKNYFGHGELFGVQIDYIEEKEPLGTAGALFYFKEKQKEDFLLLNGDIVFDIDFKRFIDYHKKKSAWVTLFTHPNSHPYDSAIIVTDRDGKVEKWLHKEDERLYYKNRTNAGIHILSSKVLETVDECKKMDLDRDILKPLITCGKIFAYDSPEYVKDMGTPERYQSVFEDMQNGLVNAKNLSRKQKACFLDRDGTINVNNGFITEPEQIKLITNVAKAISKINKSGYLAILVTNQPVIARGDCTLDMLNEIHDCLETLLGHEGAFLDDIFFCPHHPDKGFAGERVEYKKLCDCRKPRPGLLLTAAQKYNIDLTESYMIGDRENDVYAGLNAGCKPVLVSQGLAENNINHTLMHFNDLYEFVNTELIG